MCIYLSPGEFVGVGEFVDEAPQAHENIHMNKYRAVCISPGEFVQGTGECVDQMRKIREQIQNAYRAECLCMFLSR